MSSLSVFTTIDTVVYIDYIIVMSNTSVDDEIDTVEYGEDCHPLHVIENIIKLIKIHIKTVI